MWDQFSLGGQIGFRGRESVSIAASFFERKPPVTVWHKDNAALVRMERADGTVGFYDPATGEIHPGKPDEQLRTIDTATGKGVALRTREAGRRWTKTDPDADGPPMIIDRYQAGRPTLPQPPTGYEYAGPFTEIEFYDPATGRTVDTSQTRSTMLDEQLSAAIEYTAVITPGTFASLAESVASSGCSPASTAVVVASLIVNHSLEKRTYRLMLG